MTAGLVLYAWTLLINHGVQCSVIVMNLLLQYGRAKSALTFVYIGDYLALLYINYYYYYYCGYLNKVVFLQTF